MNIISVIIPVYNGERYLAETLASVMEQTRKPEEIIVVNDGSTDGTAQWLSRQRIPGLQVFEQDNAGPAAARNRGLAASTGDFVAFLDADDIWHPGKIAAQYAALAEHPDVGYVLCHLEEFHSPDMEEELKKRTPLRTGAQPGKLPSTALVRSSVFKQVGLFDPSFRTGEFMDWMLRANEAGIRSLQMMDILARRRIHDANLGRTAAASHDYHRILKAALDRKRGRKS